MKIGDKVRYAGKTKEFMGREGFITSFHKLAAHVNFGDTILICMSSELQLIEEQSEQPAFDRTAIATQILSGMMPQRQLHSTTFNKEVLVSKAIELTDELIKQLSE
jgi:hypothetical protein